MEKLKLRGLSSTIGMFCCCFQIIYHPSGSISVEPFFCIYKVLLALEFYDAISELISNCLHGLRLPLSP